MRTEIDKVHDQVLDNAYKLANINTKLDIHNTNLDKLSDISLSVSKLLAVHDQRIDSVEKTAGSAVNCIEDRRKETDAMFSRVYDKISENEKGIRLEVANSNQTVINEIKSIAADVNDLRSDINTAVNTVRVDIEQQILTREKAMTSKIDEVASRMSVIEKLIYVVTGGAAVIGAIAAWVSSYIF